MQLARNSPKARFAFGTRADVCRRTLLLDASARAHPIRPVADEARSILCSTARVFPALAV
eukprot:11449572-Alexandrium_andersonii.AAC.1